MHVALRRYLLFVAKLRSCGDLAAPVARFPAEATELIEK